MLILLIEKFLRIKKINEAFSVAKRNNLLQYDEIKEIFSNIDVK